MTSTLGKYMDKIMEDEGKIIMNSHIKELRRKFAIAVLPAILPLHKDPQIAARTAWEMADLMIETEHLGMEKYRNVG